MNTKLVVLSIALLILSIILYFQVNYSNTSYHLLATAAVIASFVSILISMDDEKK